VTHAVVEHQTVLRVGYAWFVSVVLAGAWVAMLNRLGRVLVMARSVVVTLRKAGCLVPIRTEFSGK
jgi:hypothetical protein